VEASLFDQPAASGLEGYPARYKRFRPVRPLDINQSRGHSSFSPMAVDRIMTTSEKKCPECGGTRIRVTAAENSETNTCRACDFVWTSPKTDASREKQKS
jgi:hypothetical protein